MVAEGPGREPEAGPSTRLARRVEELEQSMREMRTTHQLDRRMLGWFASELIRNEPEGGKWPRMYLAAIGFEVLCSCISPTPPSISIMNLRILRLRPWTRPSYFRHVSTYLLMRPA